MSFSKVEIQRRPSMAFFAALAFFLVIGSYVFVAALATACVYIPYLILSASDSFSPQIGVLFLFGIVIAAIMLWSLIPRRDEFTRPGMLLDRSAQPRLFAELDGIAAALGEALPSEVYLISAPNAFVADRGGVLGFGSRRVMGLGLPLLALLSVSQFRAVLAHEFAHYYGGDTSLGPWVYKTRTSMIRIFENVGSVGQLARIAILSAMYLVVAMALKWYFIAFLRAINLISRRQEYRADELACLVAGPQNLIEGLKAVHRAATAWPSYWTSQVAPHVNDGSLMAIGDGFARFVSAPEVSTAIAKNLETRLQQDKTSPYDTHPPLHDRIAAVQQLSAGSVPQDARPATVLLDNLQSTEVKFVEESLPDIRPGSLKYVSWDNVAAEVTIPGWKKFVSEYSEPLQGVTAESLPTEVPKFSEIGSRIRDPKGRLLTPAQRTSRAAGLFAAALALALIQTGWQLRIQPGIFRMWHGDQDFDPFDGVGRLMAGKLSPEAWVARCKELGISGLCLLPADAIVGHSTRETRTQGELFGSDRA